MLQSLRLSRAHRRRAAVTLSCLLLAAPAFGGGGVMLSSDSCRIAIGFYEAHFTAYQPRTRGDEEFCRSMPDTGEVVFVLDYLHDSLKEVPVEFRIIRNATGAGKFAGAGDVSALGSLEPYTVFHRPPTVEADASLQATYTFADPGDYVAIITAGHPTKDKRYTAVFPFTVGVGGFAYGWVLAVAAVLAGGLFSYLWLRPRPVRDHQQAHA